jgi:hypothetical protein
MRLRCFDRQRWENEQFTTSTSDRIMKGNMFGLLSPVRIDSDILSRDGGS